jgi:hypothetical protein
MADPTKPLRGLVERHRQRRLAKQRRLQAERQAEDPNRTIEKLVQSTFIDQKQRPY